MGEGQLWIDGGFPVKQTMRALGVSRSLYYYHPQHREEKGMSGQGRPIPGYSRDPSGKKVPDQQIKSFLMEAVEGEAGIYGYKKLTHYLQVEHGLVINHKKVYRLCHELDILLPQREKKTRHPKKVARQHRITGSNQLWEVDIK